MQDEILKHTQKIKKAMKNKKHSWKDKFKEIMIEIFIIVFAVSLSIYLHSWSEHNHQQEEVQEFLVDLKSDLNEDIIAMNRESIDMKNAVKNIDAFKKMTPSDVKKVGNIEINIGLTMRQTNTAVFEGFKSSGKIGFIENKKLKKDILEYFTQNMPPLSKIEDDRNGYNMDLIKEVSNGKSIATSIYKPEVRTLLNFSNQHANSLLKGYEENIKLAQTIINQINNELKK